MVDRAAKAIRVLGSAALLSLLSILSGCTAWRLAQLDSRLGLGAAADQSPPAPELQKSMDRLYEQGASALLANDLDGAIAAWRQYAVIAPVHLARTRTVRGYLTLLERESARRYARQVAAREKSAPFIAGDRLHVALFALRSVSPGPPAPASFNEAVMAMVTADLAQVPSLTLLERARIDDLLQELHLGASGLVDPATASLPGRLLGAGSVIVGSVSNEPGAAGPGSGRYEIDTAVCSVAQGAVIGSQQAQGLQSDFWMLEKRIVFGILETLQVTDVPPSVSRIHTRSWAAYARFATGLKLLDENRFDEARKAFHAALEADPGFDLAEQAFLDTPEKAASLEDIRRALR